MKTSLGYPDHDSTVSLLAGASDRNRAASIQPVITAKAASGMARAADGVYVDVGILSYISQIAEQSRHAPRLKLGLSVRGCLALVRAAKTWAASQGRNYVIPDDIKDLALPVLGHRLLLDAEAEFAGVRIEDVIEGLLGVVEPPSERAS